MSIVIVVTDAVTSLRVSLRNRPDTENIQYLCLKHSLSHTQSPLTLWSCSEAGSLCSDYGSVTVGEEIKRSHTITLSDQKCLIHAETHAGK